MINQNLNSKLYTSHLKPNHIVTYYPADYHVHTFFSGDSEADCVKIIENAISLNMKYICVTDHLDFDYPNDMNHDFILDGDKYYNHMKELAKKYSKKISISIGVETGLGPNYSTRLNNFISANNFDFIIGSSHVVNGKDPYYPEYFNNRSDFDAFSEYFQSILDNLKFCNNFDVYGHIDYVVRYSPNKIKNYSYTLFKDIIDEILVTLINMNKGIEINTGGFRTGINAPNPSIDIIKRYKELGGEIITLGSDAHTPELIGNRFNLAVDILKDCNFNYYTIFINRKPIFIKL